MLNFRFVMVAASCALLVVSSLKGAGAAQPVRFNYQARLTDSSGAPLQGSHTLNITVWDGGTSGAANSGIFTFAETANVTLQDGIVNHTVGTGTPVALSLTQALFETNNDLFLQVAVDSVSNV